MKPWALLWIPLLLASGCLEAGDPTVAQAPAADAPSCDLEGLVLWEDLEPLAAVLVDVAGPALRSQLTDSDGRFDFPALPAGAYLFTATRDGLLFNRTTFDCLPAGQASWVVPVERPIEAKEAYVRLDRLEGTIECWTDAPKTPWVESDPEGCGPDATLTLSVPVDNESVTGLVLEAHWDDDAPLGASRLCVLAQAPEPQDFAFDSNGEPVGPAGACGPSGLRLRLESKDGTGLFAPGTRLDLSLSPQEGGIVPAVIDQRVTVWAAVFYNQLAVPLDFEFQPSGTAEPPPDVFA